MKFTAILLAFSDEISTREIDIPDDELESLIQRVAADSEAKTAEEIESACHMGVLELAFYYGQNDFQPQPIRSLSVGDVVLLKDGARYRCRGVGWERLDPDVDIETLERGGAAAMLC